jgi:hypothetical protein
MKIVMVTNLRDDRSPWSLPCHECRSWAYVLGADTRNAGSVRGDLDLLRGYDLAIVELTSNLLSLPRDLKRAFPDLIVVGLTEGWVANVASIGVQEQCDFVAACRTVDMLGILVEDAVSYYRLYAAKPQAVQWLGIPYPRSSTENLPTISADDKEYTVFLPLGLRPVRSGIAHLLAFQKIRERYPGLRGLAPRFSRQDEAHFARIGLDVELLPPMPWASFLHRLARVYAVFNLDHLPTWGRLAADCAAARVPYVGSNATHCARALGVLTCHPFDAHTAVTYLERLLHRDHPQARRLYRRVVDEQHRRLEQLDEETSRARFWRALDRALGAGRGRTDVPPAPVSSSR